MTSARISHIVQQPGWLALRGPNIDVDKHRHRAIQLLFPLSRRCVSSVGDETFTHSSPLAIAARVDHTVRSDDALIILIDPACHLGSTLAEQFLQDRRFRLFDSCSGFSPPSDELTAAKVEALFAALGLPLCSERHIEPRIERLIAAIDSAFAAGNGSEIRLDWALERIHLSRGRFQHLFREQLGMPWRPWLLWTRLLWAARLVWQGKTMTEAALAAGFADAAHFSRTFKAMFGITPARVALES